MVRGCVGAVLLCVLSAGVFSVAPAADQDGEDEQNAKLRATVDRIANNQRGPFRRLRWFCNDGEVLPPEAYACVEHGGGRQHGQWSEDTLSLHQAGYPVANVFAELDAEDFGESASEQLHLRIVLLEQFLIASQDGWLFRNARFYRGALQAEDEEAGARRILTGLVEQSHWGKNRYALMFEAARLLPQGSDLPSVTEVRGMASMLDEADSGFGPLRAKIHGSPDLADAQRVRDYATSNRAIPDLSRQYEELALAIEELSTGPGIVAQVSALASQLGGDNVLSVKLADAATQLEHSDNMAVRLRVASKLMQAIRDDLVRVADARQKVAALNLAVALEQQVYADSVSLSQRWEGNDRSAMLNWMQDLTRAMYGTGLLTAFELEQVDRAFSELNHQEISLRTYRAELDYLARVPDWAGRRMQYFFSAAIEKLSVIEPQSAEYIADRLRASPLLGYSRILNVLSEDVGRLAMLESDLFGTPVVVGLRRLNPGLARGTLRDLADLDAGDDEGDTIIIVPETIAELPSVSGILTAHEGNYLSHVQLLARNLGIPNVVVSDQWLPVLRQYQGQKVILAASPGGIVQLVLDRGQLEENIAEAVSQPSPGTQSSGVMIHVDVQKLSLDVVDPIPTHQLTAADSGAIVGPKAAQVGELERFFPENVSPGLAIPFGAFRQMLDQQAYQGGPSMLSLLPLRYEEIASIADARQQRQAASVFLAELRQWIMATPFPPGFEQNLEQAMRDVFGPDGSYGVFVRSDTNIEDLPGFTGAGLNLTVPNVVGVSNILAAIRRVWASPFEERAYGWRQSLMDQPEHVYPAVLLHKSVYNDKSGVMITADVHTGSKEYITLVANEGIGGGVEGQSAETLLVGVSDQQIRLLNSATAPTKHVLLTQGGSAMAATTGTPRILTDEDIESLLAFSQQLPGWFAYLPLKERTQAVADVEFGFADGRMVLLQIRPFVQSRAANSNVYLQTMDEGLAGLETATIDMRDEPLSGEVAVR